MIDNPLNSFKNSLSPRSRKAAKFRKATLRNFASPDSYRECRYGKVHFGFPISWTEKQSGMLDKRLTIDAAKFACQILDLPIYNLKPSI